MRKLIIVESAGNIPLAKGTVVGGPILSPFYLDDMNIFQLLKKGIKVVEVNPRATNQKLQLTRTNYNRLTRWPSVKKAVSAPAVTERTPLQAAKENVTKAESMVIPVVLTPSEDVMTE